MYLNAPLVVSAHYCQKAHDHYTYISIMRITTIKSTITDSTAASAAEQKIEWELNITHTTQYAHWCFGYWHNWRSPYAPSVWNSVWIEHPVESVVKNKSGFCAAVTNLQLLSFLFILIVVVVILLLSAVVVVVVQRYKKLVFCLF